MLSGMLYQHQARLEAISFWFTLGSQGAREMSLFPMRNLAVHRAWMTTNYYGNFVNLPSLPRPRANYAITYNRATHTMLARLVETATAYNGRLDSVIIQPIASIGPIVMKIPRQLYDIIVNNTDIVGVPPAVMEEARKTFKYMDSDVVFAT